MIRMINDEKIIIRQKISQINIARATLNKDVLSNNGVYWFNEVLEVSKKYSCREYAQFYISIALPMFIEGILCLKKYEERIKVIEDFLSKENSDGVSLHFVLSNHKRRQNGNKN